MSKMLSLVLAACLLAFPFAIYAADYGSQPPQTQQSPPVAQPLLREGDFAMKLAAELDLGKSLDEAAAEQKLAEAGVQPANGWISDYPVTPAIIAQLNDSLMFAAAKGSLPVSYEQAQQSVIDLAYEMNLPLPAEGGAQGATTPQSTSAVSDYYASEGPPVITYYAPPAGYAYLYDWVPFPSVWFGVTFPGFFIRHHFRTTVVVNPSFGLRYPHHRAIVPNRPFGHAGHRPLFGFRHPHHKAIVPNRSFAHAGKPSFGFGHPHHGAIGPNRTFGHAGHRPFFTDHNGFHAGTMRSQRMMHANAGRPPGSMSRPGGFRPGSFGGPMHSGRAAGGFDHGRGRGR